uniref:Uncharacterized protein n=1 Tax=uncultured prokaryote TaxID=198431 RepID=A0A0H5QFI2_9ZZZZ|nr:hypothetical protein [uncultured prokaryote]
MSVKSDIAKSSQWSILAMNFTAHRLLAERILEGKIEEVPKNNPLPLCNGEDVT